MADSFAANQPGLSSPAENGAAVDIGGGDVELAQTSRGIWCGGAGDIVVTMAGGGNLTFTVGAGTLLPIRATHVLADGTDASNIVALW